MFSNQLPSDATLLRFLRARDFNLEKARELLAHSLIWRKKHNVDQILSDYEVPQVIAEYFPAGWHHYDKGVRVVRSSVIFIRVCIYHLFNYRLIT